MKLPILIDPHVHLRDPGQTSKEDFFTGSISAIAGGFGYIIDMPNNLKPIFSKTALDEKIKIAKEKTICNIGFYFGSIGDNLEEFPKVENSVFGLKIYLNQTTGGFLLDKKNLELIFRTWTDKSPILIHAENETLGIVLNILKKNPRPIHICHLSNKDELKMVMEAKQNKFPVTCGVTPHHLFLSDDQIDSKNPYTKMKPPIQSRNDLEFLWKNINHVDCIESDHAPHTIEEKSSENPPYGVPNLETTLALLLKKVGEKVIDIDTTLRLLHDGPKKIFKIRTDPNDYIEIDLKQTWTIKGRDLYTKCKWTPFENWKGQGRVTKVVLKNRTVFENNEFKINPGQGRVIHP